MEAFSTLTCTYTGDAHVVRRDTDFPTSVLNTPAKLLQRATAFVHQFVGGHTGVSVLRASGSGRRAAYALGHRFECCAACPPVRCVRVRPPGSGHAGTTERHSCGSGRAARASLPPTTRWRCAPGRRPVALSRENSPSSSWSRISPEVATTAPSVSAWWRRRRSSRRRIARSTSLNVAPLPAARGR